LECDSPFPEVSNTVLNRIDNLVKNQDDPHYGVNGAILTAREHFERDNDQELSKDYSSAT